MKTKITKSKTPNQKQPPAAAAKPTQKYFAPYTTQFLQSEVLEIRREEKRRGLAILKLMELIVSGEVPRPVGEDETLTIYRLIAHGVGDLNVSESTKKKISKALAVLKKSNRWEIKPVDILAMRGWHESRAASRAIVLITLFGKSSTHAAVAEWLEAPNPRLNGKAPIYFVQNQQWTKLADYLDALLLV